MSESKTTLAKYSPAIMLLLAVIAVVYLFIGNFDAVGNIMLVALGFGMVVLIHEFGHFIVAKMSGIKVEAFAIGFPPVVCGIRKTQDGWKIRILPKFFPKENDPEGNGILSFTTGSGANPNETEYRIGMIPFGGFVKMLGQEDTGSVEATADPRSFTNKPLASRIAVVAAGVIFNAISAIIFFMIAFMIGVRLPAPVVGDVVPNSPAAKAGLKAGDRIVQVGKDTDVDFTNIALAAALAGPNEPVTMKVQRDGALREVALVASKAGASGAMKRGFGIMQGHSLVIAEIKDPNADFIKAGLKAGDTIVAINGTPVKNSWELNNVLDKVVASTAVLTAVRTDNETGKETQITATVPVELNINLAQGDAEEDLYQVGSMVPRLKVMALSELTGLKKWLTKLGILKNGDQLRENDIIIAIGDVNNPTYAEMRKITNAHANKPLAVTVLREQGGKEETVKLTVYPKQQGDRVAIGFFPTLDVKNPVVAKTIQAKGGPSPLDIPRGATITAINGKAVANWYDIIRELKGGTEDARIEYAASQGNGQAMLNIPADPNFITVTSSLTLPFKDLREVFKATGPGNAIELGYDKTMMFIAQTYVTLKALFVGVVSTKELMGPVGIMKVSYMIVAERMWTFYIYFIGLISASIAVMNFLPFPILDGGVIVMMLIEKIKGSPISQATQAAISYVGLLLIAAFFLYVTFNDVARLF